MWIATTEKEILKPTAIALGNFDGVHRGHQRILEAILSTDNDRETEKLYPTAVSFYPHPREFFTGEKIQLLTPVVEKAKHLESLGIEQLVLLPFNRQLASLNPQQFVEEIIVKQLQAKKISVGEDFRFGYQRQGTARDLKAIAASYGIEVHINPLRQCRQEQGENVRISSSLIRQALQTGEIKQANSMLGRAYTLIGTVIKGQELGRTIGFPTANLQLPEDKFIPRYGVYSVKVTSFDKDEACLESVADSSLCNNQNIPLEDASNSMNNSPLKGVMNIGCRPTVDGNKVTVEVHLLDWSGDLYGQTLRVSLEQFLRPEQKFSSLDALKQQIAVDCETARYCLSSR